MAKVRTFEEFRKEPQYTEVLSRMPLITVEKIGDSEPMPFAKNRSWIRWTAYVPSESGMSSPAPRWAVDLAQHGADVLNIWRPGDTEVEAFAWDVQVGMRRTILDNSKADRAIFDRLLKERRRLFRQ